MNASRRLVIYAAALAIGVALYVAIFVVGTQAFGMDATAARAVSVSVLVVYSFAVVILMRTRWR